MEQANTNTYLEYEGIKGEATAKGYEKLIALNSFDFNVNREIKAQGGNSRNRESSATRLNDIQFTKELDCSSHDLFKEATIGGGKELIFHITKQGDAIEEIMEIKLGDAMISSFSISAVGDRPVEHISVSYTNIMITVTPSDDKNKLGTPVRYGYSSVTGTRL